MASKRVGGYQVAFGFRSKYRGLSGTLIKNVAGSQSPTIFNAWFFDSAGFVKIWNGTTWAAKTLKVWMGSSWLSKSVKVWNGSNWVLR